MSSSKVKPTTLQDKGSAPLKVGIQGYSGAFHEIAARFFFEEELLEIVPCHTFDELVQRVGKEEDGVDVGIMAIENTLAGSLMYNYTLLQANELSITGEVFLRIKHNLLATPGTKLEDLTEVHSHPMAIAQCREFFLKHPGIRLVETVDTALSAREISEKDMRTTGAIASTLAADLYGLHTLQSGIETNHKNYTRFLILEHGIQPNGDDSSAKVSVVFSVDHEVGSLYKVLAVLAAYNINLTKIQSSPIVGSPWEYMFFVDFLAEGKLTCQQALDAIRPLTHHLKVLGIYPQGDHFEY